jgi:hypothetical protein
MKNFINVLILSLFLLTGISFSDTKKTSFIKNLKDTLVGKTWQTTIKSTASKAIDGKKATMTCASKVNLIECKVSVEGAKTNEYEVWKFSDTLLDQVEYAAGKAGSPYGATAKETTSADERDYQINCKDEARIKCDADVSGKTYWNVKIDPKTNTFIYTVKGLLNEKSSEVGTRHIFSFSVKS